MSNEANDLTDPGRRAARLRREVAGLRQDVRRLALALAFVIFVDVLLALFVIKVWWAATR